MSKKITKDDLINMKEILQMLYLSLKQAELYQETITMAIDKLDANIVPKQEILTQNKVNLQIKPKGKLKAKPKRQSIKNIEFYTDGSCTNKHGKSQAGCGVHFPNKELKDIGKVFPCKNPTNQRAELYAILLGLKIVIEKLNPNKITIYTDSMYSINCVTNWFRKWNTNNWTNSKGEDVANKEIIQNILEIHRKFNGDIIYKHVKGHSGDKGNDIADKLATNASARKAQKDFIKKR